MDLAIVLEVDAENPNLDDLRLVNGDFVWLGPSDRAAEIAQHLKIRLRHFLGEWFLNANEGVDWFGLMEKGTGRKKIEAVIRKVITTTPGVVGINVMTLTFDDAARTLTISDLDVQIDDGTTLTAADLGPFVVTA